MIRTTFNELPFVQGFPKPRLQGFSALRVAYHQDARVQTDAFVSHLFPDAVPVILVVIFTAPVSKDRKYEV